LFPYIKKGNKGGLKTMGAKDEVRINNNNNDDDDDDDGDDGDVIMIWS